MRRKPGTVLPIEADILEAGIDLRGQGVAEYHGFLLAKEIKEREGAHLLTAHGTLYRALDRMERAGLLVSRWEDPLIAAEAHRPRRRLYRVTLAGATALAAARAATPRQATKLQPGRATL